MTPEQLAALVALLRDGCNLQQRDGEHAAAAIEHLQAEVARLSTPPDDAEVAALVKRLSGTPLYGGHGEASDAPDEAADALTRLSHAHAAERKLADAMESAINGMVEILDRNETKGPIPDVEMMFCWMAAQDIRATHAARRKE